MKKESLRVLFDLLLIAIVMGIFMAGSYLLLPAPLQLIMVKVILVSGGLAHGHVSGKAMFPKVDWEGTWAPAHVARLVIYATVVTAYSLGG